MIFSKNRKIFFLFTVLFILLFLLFVYATEYNGVTPACGATTSDDSFFSTAQDCSLGPFDGPTIDTNDVELDCAYYTLTGDGGAGSNFGIKTTALHSIIKRCKKKYLGSELH